jgi:AcrR family transcriptional regulator
MSDVNTSSVAKRRYRSPLRESQAAATRSRILDAALDEFVERGYPGTSVAAIARAAGVSPETIYATFGTKRGLIDGLLAQVDAEGRPQQAAAMSEERGGGPRVELDVVAELITDFWSRHGRLVRLLRQGIGDPEIGHEWLRRQQWRRELLHGLVARWQAGTLRKGLDPEAAADVLWSLTSDELFELLVGVRGWPPDAYLAWVKGALRRELLAGRSRRAAVERSDEIE